MEHKPYQFDEAMCGGSFNGDLEDVAKYLTDHGYPSVAIKGSYNGAPSEERQAEDGAKIPPDRLFWEAVAIADAG